MGMQAVQPSSQELQKQGRKGKREEEVDEQIQGPDKQGNAVWSKGGEETRGDEGRGKNALDVERRDTRSGSVRI